jgi:hypothetical protein
LLHLAWIVPLALLAFFIASPRQRGDIAEARVRRVLAQGLERHRYTVLNDVVVPAGGGTVEIDHVVVSRFGIFVIESVYARGWVSGTAVQDRWTMRGLAGTARFDNPVHQNALQAQALERLLGLPARAFHPFVVFTGQKGFKKEPPPNVVAAEQLIPRMRRTGQALLDAGQVDAALQAIDAARLSPRKGVFVHKGTILRLLLFLLLLAGLYAAFRVEIHDLAGGLEQHSELRSNPGAFHPDGRPKTERELWEDSLRCAYSVDTGRCACFEPGGQRADLDPEACRDLAERGSVLQR